MIPAGASDRNIIMGAEDKGTKATGKQGSNI